MKRNRQKRNEKIINKLKFTCLKFLFTMTFLLLIINFIRFILIMLFYFSPIIPASFPCWVSCSIFNKNDSIMEIEIPKTNFLFKQFVFIHLYQIFISRIATIIDIFPSKFIKYLYFYLNSCVCAESNRS
ncbi:hypothetical protein EDEG_00121 [Edhazardia aedis USNM 41457]|uniref:Uncharacterized protein n=1 Tax=Edhazardia aedis (strain USNM 41457) TaxID=1003232 RepID=J9DAV5_EDHAE|nr:hypothetical protein EDEG_00121 [Edhazardia aedis USNM 41457]|eukprot:EJW04901.1 hypothetical protein EDEG_00121 [Edhazardia aedis USNM 41457]